MHQLFLQSICQSFCKCKCRDWDFLLQWNYSCIVSIVSQMSAVYVCRSSVTPCFHFLGKAQCSGCFSMHPMTQWLIQSTRTHTHGKYRSDFNSWLLSCDSLDVGTVTNQIQCCCLAHIRVCLSLVHLNEIYTLVGRNNDGCSKWRSSNILLVTRRIKIMDWVRSSKWSRCSFTSKGAS